MYIEDDELRGLYKTSAAEHIQAIESALMQLEKQPQNPPVLKELLRSAHTLKGDSRMLGVGDVETLVHQIEECLMPLEQGREQMTDELCDRLYVGLDTIKQLAHTAVTGEANDVNMFYVLATLMGDAGVAAVPGGRFSTGEAPPTIAPDLVQSLEIQPSLADLGDDLASDGWVALSNEEPVFEMSADFWVHEGNSLPTPVVAVEPLPWDASTAAPSQLQTDFLALAADLFPVDSTLPQLDRDTVFGDFTMMPGTEPVSEVDSVLFATDDLTSRMEEIDSVDRVTSWADRGANELQLSRLGELAEDEGSLFDTFEPTLMPAIDNFSPTLPPGVADPTVQRRLVADSAVAQDRVITPTRSVQSTDPVAPTINAIDYQIETIRVEAKQLDTLMGQSGEINVINQQIATRLLDLEALTELWENGSRDRQQLQALSEQISPQSPLYRQLNRDRQQWEQMGKLIGKFKKAIGGDSSRLDLVTTALESGVKQLRLMPMATIFNLFPRLVRDLAKTQAKEINLTIEGGDLLLDKRLLEEIKDPLMHILRNAIDHGIETPAERQQHGKLAAANLKIQVHQTGNQTTIEILDDGRGLDVQRIKATAIKRGLYTSAELELMSTERIQSLIFVAGFSTRSRVTELSGRGVGLDIVRTNVERIKGSVDVESTPNRGCTFRLVLSQAIGSSQVMMVDVRHHTYAIPVEFIERMLLVNKAEIFALSGTSSTEIDGQTTTVAWLADLLCLPTVAPDSPGAIDRTTKTIACLLIRSGRQRLALLVDRIDDRQLVTIEAPHPLLKTVPHLTGSTILGTGAVCLVLNPIDLLATAAGGNPLIATAATTADRIGEERPPAILLVEDSRVIRIQMTRILERAGYLVTTANDGVAGWEQLQAGQFDLIISDVEMPRWSGLELMTEIRNHPQYQDLPAILVTTLATAADRDRGFQAGANAYLTKGDFDQQLLLDTLARLI